LFKFFMIIDIKQFSYESSCLLKNAKNAKWYVMTLLIFIITIKWWKAKTRYLFSKFLY
jgi:hypothetical protein